MLVQIYTRYMFVGGREGGEEASSSSKAGKSSCFVCRSRPWNWCLLWTVKWSPGLFSETLNVPSRHLDEAPAKNPHQVCLKLPSFPCVHHQRSLSYLLSMHAEVSWGSPPPSTSPLACLKTILDLYWNLSVHGRIQFIFTMEFRVGLPPREPRANTYLLGRES